jgi:hypothetical protein
MHALSLRGKIKKTVFGTLMDLPAEQAILIDVRSAHGVARRATVHAEALGAAVWVHTLIAARMDATERDRRVHEQRYCASHGSLPKLKH